MNRLFNYLTLILISVLLVGFSNSCFAYQVEGKISLDDSWARKIYLSVIPSFEEMNTASSDLIINETIIEDDGSFILLGNNISEADRLYRLHICKKGDPNATLFIGGKEENHVHFIMNNLSGLHFSADFIFQNVALSGHPANSSLNFFARKNKSFHRPPKLNSEMNRQLQQRQHQEFMLEFIDTCSVPIVGQLAMSKMDLGYISNSFPELVGKKIKEWENNDGNSPYLTTLKKELDIYRKPGSWLAGNRFYWFILVVAGILVLAFLTKINPLKSPDKKGADNLSVQERRVLGMLSDGKTNKEISEELHIGVSTVKSHVSSIFSKMGVRSRKELFNIKN